MHASVHHLGPGAKKKKVGTKKRKTDRNGLNLAQLVSLS